MDMAGKRSHGSSCMDMAGERPNQDSMQISKELRYVTTCLLGQSITVQIIFNCFFIGKLKAASLDKNYGLLINVHGRDITLYRRDIVQISAKNVPLKLKKDARPAFLMEENDPKVVTGTNTHSSGGKSKEDTHATVDNATSFSSGTNTVPDPEVRQSWDYTNASSHGATSMPRSMNTVPCPMVQQPWEYTNATSYGATSVPRSINTVPFPLGRQSWECTNAMSHGATSVPRSVNTVPFLMVQQCWECTNAPSRGARRLPRSMNTVPFPMAQQSRAYTNATSHGPTSVPRSVNAVPHPMPSLHYIGPPQTDNDQPHVVIDPHYIIKTLQQRNQVSQNSSVQMGPLYSYNKEGYFEPIPGSLHYNGANFHVIPENHHSFHD